MARISKLLVSLAIVGMAGWGLGGGGTLPLKMGGSAKPVSGGNPVEARVKLQDAIAPVGHDLNDQSVARDATIRAQCARAGLKYILEPGEIKIGATSYQILGVCANLGPNDDGSREVFASANGVSIRVANAKLSGAEGAKQLSGSVYEKRGNGAEVLTHSVVLRQ